MFLMNAPPVLALQSRWEAFRPPGALRLPGCFSEPAEGVGGAAVSAGVQMLIRTLRRGDPAALGTSHERLQRRQGPERQRDAPPAASPAEPQHGPTACVPGTVALHPAGGEGATGPGAPTPDSDSDDSVDRGIEEAIQEYLKARSGGTQPSGATHADSQRPLQPPCAAPCPPRPAHHPRSGPQKTSEPLGPASPGSASSEDSFEQSIRAEIEQFLSEKRQLEAPRGAVCADRKVGPTEPPARPALRAQREPELAATAKEFVFRKPPRFAKIPAQPRSLRSKVISEPGPGGTRPSTCRSSELAQNKGGLRRGAGRRGKRGPSTVLVQEAPDSSSDDGIEEAIQLYQLEKRREAGGAAPGPPAPGTGHIASSTLPESHRKVAAGTRKPPAGKAVDPGPSALEPGASTRLPADAKAGVAATRAEAGGRGPCRADASTELLCAEAILDISKTILPAPAQGSERAPAAGPPSPPPHMPSGSDGGSSAVDSDDSIEQEIRTFLALKAQADTSPAAAQGQPGDLQGPLPPSLALSLSRKRRRRADRHWPALATPRSTREMRKEGVQEAVPLQGRVSETPTKEGESRTLSRMAGPGDQLVVSDTPTSLAPGPRRAVEKESSDDKSSSLDSDEDLDTAIKDLLRSKRKRRKGCGDPRTAPPMKVSLGAAPKVLCRLEGLRSAWKDKGPVLWRRCFPRRARGTPREPPTSGTPRRIQLEAGTQAGPPGLLAQRTPKFSFLSGPREPQRPAPSPSSASEEDSSSVDSDDSIELEIRRFLAEKAKESLVGPGAPGADSSPRPELLCRKALTPGVCAQSQRGRGATSPACAFAQARRSSPRAELACLPTGPPRSAKGSPGSRRPVCAHRDQSPRKAEPAASESTVGTLPGCPTAAVPAESPSAHCPGQSSLGQGLAAGREAGALASMALPWADFAQQSRPQSLWALSPEGSGGWKGGQSSQREEGAEGQARCLPSLALDPRKGPPSACFSPLLPTQLFHFGKSVSWGGKPAGLFSSTLSVPTRGPSFAAFRGAQAAPGPVFGSSYTLLKKEGDPWLPGRAPAGHAVPDTRRVGSDESPRVQSEAGAEGARPGQRRQ